MTSTRVAGRDPDMMKPRKHERISLVADVVVHPGDGRTGRFAAGMCDVSKSGCRIFSAYGLPQGTPLNVEVIIPVQGLGMRRVVLPAVVRWVKNGVDGNVLALQFQPGSEDYDWFARHVEERQARSPQHARGAFTLVEAMIALGIICLLVTMATPLYSRAMEQARVDAAAGNLKTIWSAQRIYWLEHRGFAADLADLEEMDLIDKDVSGSQSVPGAAFVYMIVSADEGSFTAKAMRNGSGIWVGQLQIDEDGEVAGSITGPGGVKLTPPS